jgi:hypothetical protein
MLRQTDAAFGFIALVLTAQRDSSQDKRLQISDMRFKIKILKM